MDVDTSLNNDNTLSYTVSPSKKDAVDIKGTDTVLDVTDLAVTNPKAVNVRAGQTNGKSVTAKLGVDSNSDRQLWAWEIPAPSTKANEQSRITPVVDAEVAPWTIENDNCLPLVPSATTSKPIIADGTEYSTGITVANAEKDYQRLTGTVSIGGKTIRQGLRHPAQGRDRRGGQRQAGEGRRGAVCPAARSDEGLALRGLQPAAGPARRARHTRKAQPAPRGWAFWRLLPPPAL